MKDELHVKLARAGFYKKITVCDFAGCCGADLSELIEACGKNFISLQKMHKYWYAVANTQNDIKEAEGSTPEGAVARLWLELQK